MVYESEPICRSTLKAREETLGRTHPDTLTSASNLAGLLQGTGSKPQHGAHRRGEVAPRGLRRASARPSWTWTCGCGWAFGASSNSEFLTLSEAKEWKGRRCDKCDLSG